MPEFGDQSLIFLVSQPRAGSTLLQRMLGRHSAVHTTAEPWLMLHLVYARRAAGHVAEYDAALAHLALQDFLATLPDGDAAYDAALREMALGLYGRAAAAAHKPYFLDKTPRYYLILPELARIFPRARFIILRRNPLAVLASYLRSFVKEHWILLARYRDDLLRAPRLLADGVDSLGERAAVVDYAALVTAPEAALAQLCVRLGLDFQPEMVAYGAGTPPAGRMGDADGTARHVRPSPAHLDTWLELARAPQTRHFLQSYLDALGPALLARLGFVAAELQAQLDAVSCAAQPPAVTWDAIFGPDPALSRRQVYVELALLEHRRLVYALRGLWRRLRPGGGRS